MLAKVAKGEDLVHRRLAGVKDTFPTDSELLIWDELATIDMQVFVKL
ncbi:hypothetical protein AOX55_00005936 (plasmid) [Sinorhizobium fredii CCBAU 25509]|nr:hypothetical protein AOX55_00005936 [Sinorhizobium fredii CCBAU 25509]